LRHGKADAEGGTEPVAQGPGRGVGVERQQEDAFVAACCADIRMVDAGIRHDEAEPMLDDQQPRPMADDAPRFAEHRLDKTRVLVEFRGERDRPLRGPDRRQLDLAPLGLRDDFLRDDQDVVGFGREPVGGEGLDRDRAEIVARLDELDAGKRLEADLGGHQPSWARKSGSTRSA
jgi:hypothetical protein